MIRKQDQWVESISLASIGLFLICFRDMDFLKSPTFWGDETTYLFSKAYDFGWSSIFMPHAGYIQIPQMIFNNLAFSLGGLEWAPFYTAWFGILMNFVPVLIIVFGSSVFNWTLLSKAFLVVFTVTACDDGNSYSTMNMHFIFAWITGLLLFENEPKSGWRKVLYFGAMVFSPLAGPIPSIFTPFYFFRWFRERSRFNLWCFLLISLSFAASFVFFLIQFMSGDPEIHGSRFVNFDPGYFSIRYILFWLIGNPFGYFEEINRPVTFFSIFLFGYVLIKNKSKPYYWMLAVSIFLTSMIPFLLSRGMDGGHRYVYAANLLFVMMILHYYQENQSKKWVMLYLMLLVCGSLLSYSPKHVNMTRMKKIDWQQEVKKWKSDSTYALKTYPYRQWDTTNPWTLEIKPKFK